LYVDGVKVAATTSGTWGTSFGRNQADIAGGNDFIDYKFAVDNIVIWNYAKTDFSDRFYEDPTCATDVSTQVRVSRGGFRFNRGSGHFSQVVTLTNTGATPIQGPASLALDNLSSNATLYNKTSNTTCTMPSGSPYIDVNVGSDNIFSPGEKATVVLEFTDSNNQGITYKTRVLTGSGSR
jgi:hypothetical protein